MDNASWSSFNNYSIQTYALTPKYILEKTVFGRTNKLTAGIDYYREPFKMDRYATRERTRKLGVVDLERQTVGYYLRDEFQIFDPLILTGGYRWEEANISGNSLTLPATVDFDTKKTHRGDAYELGLTYLIGEKSKVFLAGMPRPTVCRSSRAGLVLRLGNGFLADLEKEKARTMEWGTSLNC